ncbi:MAG: hypothetical protein LBC43_01615 [Bifidobacteriaceae bacterium]|jgi:hypothetical protein|nr:hypothetical protein [Bifidobacteriaceae bacterium]
MGRVLRWVKQEFDVYHLKVPYLDIITTKPRPLVITNLQDYGDYFKGNAVYSWKPRWDQYPEVYDLFYYVKDRAVAGLKDKYESYIDISRQHLFNKKDLNLTEYLGSLSVRDVIGLRDAIVHLEVIKIDAKKTNPERIFDYLTLRNEYIMKDKGLPTPGNHHKQYNKENDPNLPDPTAEFILEQERLQAEELGLQR